MVKKLKAPAGTDEANIGPQSFKVDTKDHTITLPDGVDAGPLLTTGGFTEVVDDVAPPEGMVAMKHPTDPNASCSVGKARSDGIHIVPATAVAELLNHGFVVVEGASAEPAPAPPTEAAPAA